MSVSFSLLFSVPALLGFVLLICDLTRAFFYKGGHRERTCKVFIVDPFTIRIRPRTLMNTKISISPLESHNGRGSTLGSSRFWLLDFYIFIIFFKFSLVTFVSGKNRVRKYLVPSSPGNTTSAVVLPCSLQREDMNECHQVDEKTR